MRPILKDYHLPSSFSLIRTKQGPKSNFCKSTGIHTTIDIQSTENPPTPTREDKDQTFLKIVLLKPKKKVYEKDVVRY